MANVFPINKVKEQARKIKTNSILNSIKIIDRIVFICFAEDRELIPDNMLHERQK